MKLFGHEYSEKEVNERFGDYGIAMGYRQYSLEDGKEENIHVCELNNGAGLRLEILKSRGLDLGRCTFKELPISYRSYDGDCHPTYYETFDDGWLRSFAGGLLVTGGLSNIGLPICDKGETLPLHGRISNIPCMEFNVENVWNNDEMYILAKGKVRESKALKYNLLLTRTITMKCGENSFHIQDRVRNEGFENTEHMMLYHFNIGHPILTEGSNFYSNSKCVEPRDGIAKQRTESHSAYLGPTEDYPDVVYYHDLYADEEGTCHILLVNEKLEIGIALSFSKKNLDQFTQWKFTAKGNYVAGIEPGNARVDGRDIEREKGRVKILKAQEHIDYDIWVHILQGKKDINHFVKEKRLHL